MWLRAPSANPDRVGAAGSTGTVCGRELSHVRTDPSRRSRRRRRRAPLRPARRPGGGHRPTRTPIPAGATFGGTVVLPAAVGGQPLDNVEGITRGPRLPDGRQSVLLVSDDNVTAGQASQVLLLALG